MMKYLRIYEDFEWEFDFEEESDILPKIGQRIAFRDKMTAWMYTSNMKAGEWNNIPHSHSDIYIVDDIKHIDDIDYLYSHINGKKVFLSEYSEPKWKLPTDYDGYMVHTRSGGWPWYKLEDWYIVDDVNEDFDWDFDEEEIELNEDDIKVGDIVTLPIGDEEEKTIGQIKYKGYYRGDINGEYRKESHHWTITREVEEVAYRDDGVKLIRFIGQWPFRVSSAYKKVKK